MANDIFQTAPNFVNPAYATPEQIAALRAYSSQLLTGPGQQKVKSPAQGMSNVVNALVGGYLGYRADEEQKKAISEAAKQTTPLIQQLMGGAPSAPGATGAPQVSDASEPRGLRNNNPGNIEDGPYAQSQPGYVGSDGRFAKFATPEHGAAAMDSLLSSYGQRGLNTPASIINRWAPPGENNSNAYAATVAKALGVSPTTSLDMSDPAVRQQLASAMAGVENGRPVQMASLGPATGGVASPVNGQAQGGSPPTPAPAQVAQNGQLNPAQVAAILQNPYIAKETKDMILGLVQPKIITDPYGRPMTYRLGDQTGAHLIPGVPGGVMKEGKFGGGVELPVVVTPPAQPGGQPGLAVPGGSAGTGVSQGPLGGAQPIIEQAQKNAAELERQKTTASEGAKASMVPIAEAMKEVKTAPQALNAVNVIEDVAKNYGDKITTGPAGEGVLKLKQAVNGLVGSDVMGSTAPAELIKKMNAQLASAALPAFTNRGTQFDLKVFMENNPGLNNSIQGTLFLTNLMKQIYRQNLEVGQLASDQRNWGNWGQVQADYYKSHPLVNPLTGTPLGVKEDTKQQSNDGGWKDMGNGIRIRQKQ